MLKVVTKRKKFEKLYLDLLYACNFNCRHCFHGDKLQSKEQIDVEEAKKIITLFRENYRSTSLILLGGEPFLYSNLFELVLFAKQIGFKVEICSNGYKIDTKLIKIADSVDHLRISIDGLEKNHDSLRKAGSFREACETLAFAGRIGINASVTYTVNRQNLTDVIPLANEVQKYGVKYIKLHCLRMVGNVLKNPGLVIEKEEDFRALIDKIEKYCTSLKMPIIFDEELLTGCESKNLMKNIKVSEKPNRVEIHPNGSVFLSCMAVGEPLNAFFYDKHIGDIRYLPRRRDELNQKIKQVRYFQFKQAS
jgi:MoaA/NifB/PqqE/SkfB family radical SAM enzyme